MEKKFTKGEWTFYETPNYHEPECSRIEVSSRESSFWICKVQNSGYIAEDEGLANAKLIAAAPELLARLNSLVLSVKAHPDYQFGEEGDEWHDVVSLAEETIKKATE